MKILNALSKRFSDRSEDSIRNEILSLKAELRTFAREHDGHIREQRHELVDRALAEAQTQADRLMVATQRDEHLNPATLAADAAAWTAVRDPILVAALHTAVDNAADLSPLTKAVYEAKLAEYESQIDARRLELERREAAAQLEEAKRGLADVASRAEA